VVLAQAVGEGVQGGQRVGADGGDPLVEVLALELGHHRGEAAHVGGGGCQSGLASSSWARAAAVCWSR